MDKIHVHVVKYRECKNLVLRYIDPLTGKQVRKSSGTASKAEARRLAHQWEADLNSGRDQGRHTVTWELFRLRYEDEVVPGLAPTTGNKIAGVLNAVETILPRVKTGRVCDLTPERLSQLQSELRKLGRSESTIASHFAHLRAALQWAADQGIIPAVPKMKRPKRAKKARNTSPMKGRPISLEEFERMLRATRKVVGKPAAKCWRRYLVGLWWSGLRLEESLNLYWDRPDRLCVDLSGKWVMLRIPAELEKGHQDRLLPVAPEFARFLLRTPPEKRRGRVFRLVRQKGNPETRKDTVSKVVSDIGRSAGIKVSVKTVTDAKTGQTAEKVKYASAHDLRRSFAERWAVRVMPQVLKELMRHESIETSLRFYVGRNAQTTAEALWAAYENGRKGTVLGTVACFQSPATPTEKPQTPCGERVKEVRLSGLEPETYGLKAAVRPRRNLKPFAVSPYPSVPSAVIFLTQETDKSPEKPALRLSRQPALALRVRGTCSGPKTSQQAVVATTATAADNRHLYLYRAGRR
jgi:integrase